MFHSYTLKRGSLTSFWMARLCLLKSVVGALIFLASCSSDQPPDLPLACDCPFRVPLGTSTEFKDTIESQSGWAAKMKLKLEANINEWLRGELRGDVRSPIKRENATLHVYQNIKDTNPGRTYDLVVAEAFFCAYHRILCETITMTEDEKVKLILDELERLRTEFNSSQSPKPIKQPTEFKRKKPKVSSISVVVLTDPPGANIFLDKAEQPNKKSFKGKSNRTLFLEPGVYSIEISMPGYEPDINILDVPSGAKDPQVYAAVLIPNHI